MSVQKIFVYYDIVNNSEIFLHGPDHADPKKLLSMYVNWYNEDFITTPPDLNNHKIDISNFTYCYSRCPLDFYDDYISSDNADK